MGERGGQDRDGPALDGDGGRPRFADLTEPAGGWGRPVAVTLPDAAELLAEDLARVEQAAAAVEPYRHANGSPRWSVMLLERELGRQPATSQGSSWRRQNRATYRHQHGPD
jgi:hypothetical protein